MHHLFPVAVHLFFFIENRVLLLRRFNTGWEDGKYSVPAGHVEENESATEAAIREAYEEVGVILTPEDIEVVHVMHRKSEQERFDLFFAVKHWNGEIVNHEPNKSDDLRWYAFKNLPDIIIPYVREGLENYQNDIAYSEFGW